jgi:hypothetical protein
MEPIWRALPNDLALYIINFLDDIDIRRVFGFAPRRLVINKQFNFRNEFIYDRATRTMFDFSGMSDVEEPYWIIRRGIPFSQYRSPCLFIFNMEWEGYDMTLFTHGHQLGPSVCSNHIVLDKNVKFK